MGAPLEGLKSPIGAVWFSLKHRNRRPQVGQLVSLILRAVGVGSCGSMLNNMVYLTSQILVLLHMLAVLIYLDLR